MIPDQIIDVLDGSDVLLIPPASEGTVPTPSEQFAIEHAEALVDLGLVIARDTGKSDEDASYLLFNPDVFDPGTVERFAMQGRLAEFVNGLGNNQKPENPTHMVSVKSAATGDPIRDVLVDSPEKAAAAIQRNDSPKRTVELNPVTPDNLNNTLLARVKGIGAVPNPLV